MYLLCVAGQAGSRWVWHGGGPLSSSCGQLFPSVCLQTVAEGVADLSVLLRLVDVDVALGGGRPCVGEQAAVLDLEAASLGDQRQARLTVAEQRVGIAQTLNVRGKTGVEESAIIFVRSPMCV